MKQTALLHCLPALLALACAAALSGCRAPARLAATATMNPAQVAATVNAKLTLAVFLTNTPAATLPPVSPAPTLAYTAVNAEPTFTLAPAASPRVPTPTSPEEDLPCNRAAPGVPIDVTIDDDTSMQPGEHFTKIWRLVNAGTCTWSRGYQATWFSGTKMGDVQWVPLPEEILPGQSVDISVDLVAPDAAGTYQSNWKLESETKEGFGIGPSGSSPFWVRIVVIEIQPTEIIIPDTPIPSETPTPTLTVSPTLEPTATPTPSLTPSPTPSSTATTPVQMSGIANLPPGAIIDLDTGQMGPNEGDDLLYITGEQENHWLAPQAGTTLGFYGVSEPSPEICQSANMSSAPIAVESLPPAIYLCYQTSDGHWGWLRLNAMDASTFSISVDYKTWSQP